MRSARQLLTFALRRIAQALVSAAEEIWHPPAAQEPPPSPKQLAHARWVAETGDKTLRLQYPLNRSDIVFDVGGFEGQWASDVFSRYLTQIHIFEPIPEFANQITQRFAANERIRLHRCALGPSMGSSLISIQGDASSQVALRADAPRVEIETKTLKSVLESEGIHQVALMKVNIEGAEYDFLEDLIATGLITSIRDLQIQFHDFVPNAEQRMKAIQTALSRTHRLTWQFQFIWENWRRINVGE